MLMAKYPKLGKAAVRTILRRASKVEFKDGAAFRFFDPATMMPRAFELAEKHLSSRP